MGDAGGLGNHQQLSCRQKKEEPITLRRFLRNFNKEHGYKVYAATLSKEEQSHIDCLTAKREELEKLKSFDAYEEVKYQGQTCISARWVLTLKGGRPKARLVVRAFEKENKEISCLRRM